MLFSFLLISLVSALTNGDSEAVALQTYLKNYGIDVDVADICTSPVMCYFDGYYALYLNGRLIGKEIIQFPALDTLRFLNLGNNQISAIKDGTFSKLSKLTQLSLDSNNFLSVESMGLTGLDSLTFLSLRYNKIDLKEGMFSKVNSLVDLDLRSNGIKTIPPNTFLGLTNLETLSLMENEITDLPRGSFEGLTGLLQMSLYKNSLTTLSIWPFFPLVNLKTLDLSYNQISTLTVGVFYYLTNLETLVLNNNMLRSLNGDVFTGLNSLKVIGVDSNKLVSFGAGSLTTVPNVAAISLVGNNLKTFEPTMFEPLSKLNGLLLDENDICGTYAVSTDTLTIEGSECKYIQVDHKIVCPQCSANIVGDVGQHLITSYISQLSPTLQQTISPSLGTITKSLIGQAVLSTIPPETVQKMYNIVVQLPTNVNNLPGALMQLYPQIIDVYNTIPPQTPLVKAALKNFMQPFIQSLPTSIQPLLNSFFP